MRLVLTIYWCALVSGIIFFVTKGLMEVYIGSLKSTGGVVMARDLLGVEIAPWIMAVCAIIFVVTIRSEK